MLNKAPRDTDSINDKSSNDEKLNVLFRVMSIETYFNYI